MKERQILRFLSFTDPPFSWTSTLGKRVPAIQTDMVKDTEASLLFQLASWQFGRAMNLKTQPESHSAQGKLQALLCLFNSKAWAFRYTRVPVTPEQGAASALVGLCVGPVHPVLDLPPGLRWFGVCSESTISLPSPQALTMLPSLPLANSSKASFQCPSSPASQALPMKSQATNTFLTSPSSFSSAKGWTPTIGLELAPRTSELLSAAFSLATLLL